MTIQYIKSLSMNSMLDVLTINDDSSNKMLGINIFADISTTFKA